MDFSLSPEIEELRRRTHDFIATHVLPLEGDPALQPGQCRAQAVVHPGAEREVAARVGSVQAQGVGVGTPLALVAVRRPETGHDEGPLRDGAAVDVDVVAALSEQRLKFGHLLLVQVINFFFAVAHLRSFRIVEAAREVRSRQCVVQRVVPSHHRIEIRVGEECGAFSS